MVRYPFILKIPDFPQKNINLVIPDEYLHFSSGRKEPKDMKLSEKVEEHLEGWFSELHLLHLQQNDTSYG